MLNPLSRRFFIQHPKKFLLSIEGEGEECMQRVERKSTEVIVEEEEEEAEDGNRRRMTDEADGERGEKKKKKRMK
jgi:hypothetical protein